VSETPFSSGSLQAALDDGRVWSRRVAGRTGRTTELPVGRRGRYVRVQLAGEGYLSLAEVEVFARPATASPR
jgi:alpha-L-fucosidase 2